MRLFDSFAFHRSKKAIRFGIKKLIRKYPLFSNARLFLNAIDPKKTKEFWEEHSRTADRLFYHERVSASCLTLTGLYHFQDLYLATFRFTVKTFLRRLDCIVKPRYKKAVKRLKEDILTQFLKLDARSTNYLTLYY